MTGRDRARDRARTHARYHSRKPPPIAGARADYWGDLVTLVSGHVSSWADQVGANPMTQATAALRPTVTSGGAHQGVVCDGVEQVMAGAGVAATKPCTIYLVASITAPGAGNGVFVDSSTGATECYCGASTTGLYGGAVLTGGAGPSGSVECYAFHFGGAGTSTINRNNTIIATGPGGNIVSTGIMIGAQNGQSNFCACTIWRLTVAGDDSFATQQAVLRANAAYFGVSGVS